ncbi:MAG: hypothetical protein Q7T76_02820 [Ferruginibacter sp.]|nr:hypothetical protein [Ferruginibacter sp.]
MKISIPSLFVLLSITVGACNSTTTKEAEPTSRDTTEAEMKVMIPGMVCYAGVVGKDSIFLKTEKFPTVVTGKLQYNFNEKDDSNGDIDGVMHGDTLVAAYTFGAEGTTSVREVAFLLSESGAIEGYGPMEEKDGKMVFTNRSQLSFGSGFNLKTIPCPQQ